MCTTGFYPYWTMRKRGRPVILRNEDWQEGQSTSVILAMKNLPPEAQGVSKAHAIRPFHACSPAVTRKVTTALPALSPAEHVRRSSSACSRRGGTSPPRVPTEGVRVSRDFFAGCQIICW